MLRSVFLVALVGLSSVAPVAAGAANELPPHQVLARDLFKELIEINSVGDKGATPVARALHARLAAAGFTDDEMILAGVTPQNLNLIVRLRGAGRQRPVLFIGHMDVVEALRSDWTTDPFQLVERDGYYYGRGTIDMKDNLVAMAVALIRMKQEHYVPAGDIIVAFTDHEEGGPANGAVWLAHEHRDWIDAAYGINPDGGNGTTKDGKPLLLEFQTAEKTYAAIDLEVTNPGGHGSVPEPDNAIYRLAAGLQRLAAFQFPVQLNETTRAYFERSAAQETGALRDAMLAIARDPADAAAAARISAASAHYNALLRTTVVATQLAAGHAENALPQSARATLNGRFLPDDPPEHVRESLVRVLADDQIRITRFQVYPAGPLSKIDAGVFAKVEQLAHARWPGVRVVPIMGTGATDSVQFRLLGIPMFGVSGTFVPLNENRAHGRDERIGVQEFRTSVDFMYDLMHALTQ